MNCYYISRNYKHPKCGGGRARTDIEAIMSGMGFKNIGLPTTTYRNGIVHAVRNTLGTLRAIGKLRKGDVLVIQYQMRLYQEICRAAHRRGARIICLIHDLDSFRDKKLTPEQEIPLLNMADVILTHNHNMRRWLSAHGCRVEMIDYEIMDYLPGESAEPHPAKPNGDYSLFFVGNLSPAINDFLYQLADIMPERDIYLYGSELDVTKAATRPNMHYMGLVDDHEIIARHSGDFGLSWYGLSLNDGIGKVGEYMAYNNPHKVGLYLRCNAPVVVWKQAGRARLIEHENIGLAVSSLRELNSALTNLTPEDYNKMISNVACINRKLKEGYFLHKALGAALEYLKDNPHPNHETNSPVLHLHPHME